MQFNMKKAIVVLLLLFSSFPMSNAQEVVHDGGKQTIYFDADYNIVSDKSKATYYTILKNGTIDNPTVANPSSDYYMSGIIHWKGDIFSISKNSYIIDGLCTWYDKQGNKQYQVTVSRNVWSGKYYEWWPNGKIKEESNYVNGNKDGCEFKWDENGKCISGNLAVIESEYKQNPNDPKYKINCECTNIAQAEEVTDNANNNSNSVAANGDNNPSVSQGSIEPIRDETDYWTKEQTEQWILQKLNNEKTPVTYQDGTYTFINCYLKKCSIEDGFMLLEGILTADNNFEQIQKYKFPINQVKSVSFQNNALMINLDCVDCSQQTLKVWTHKTNKNVNYAGIFCQSDVEDNLGEKLEKAFLHLKKISNGNTGNNSDNHNNVLTNGEDDAFVRQQLMEADQNYNVKNYYGASAIYYKYRDNHLFTSTEQCNLGIMYYAAYGGFKQDFDEAFKWYYKSAAQNNAEGQFELGTCYEFGIGTTKNIDYAKEMYRKAAVNGSLTAPFYCKRLGITY